MPPSEILTALAKAESVQPEEALASADAHRAALVEPLLAALNSAAHRRREAAACGGRRF
jgi:hypothetical protein